MKKTRILVMVLVLAMLMAVTTTAFAGFNEDGYNYKANIFVGDYSGDGSQLVMKWNDAWLDQDGVRHDGFDTYIDSGAWCTNHWVGTYEEEGVIYKYTEFIKIVAVRSTDVLVDGFWFDEDGNEIGELIWGQFAIVMDIYNDSGTGDHGVFYKGRPNLGML